ncbi:MAG: carbohydrate ABC transporter permease [Anaerolineae bacterium]|nr:carbohydrate ABC transporter permease [Anaerolineae bacterium]
MSVITTEAIRARAQARTRTVARARSLVGRAILHLVLIVASVAMMLPMLWMTSTSLKVSGQEWVFPPKWIPNPVAWRNYVEFMEVLAVPFYRYVINTLTITVFATLGTLLTSSLAAFAFARLRFWGRERVFFLVISTMMLPGVVTLVPTFLIFRYLGWLNTFLPLTVPYWLGGTAFSVFLLRQFFLSLPYELDEAARMDGASNFWIYYRIAIPLSGPALASVLIFQVLDHWNAFMGPLIYLNSMHKYTLALALRTFQNTRSQRVNYLMAASMIQVLPVIILFFIAQRYFIRGISVTGLAGR